MAISTRTARRSAATQLALEGRRRDRAAHARGVAASLVFTLTYGTLAAKSRRAGMVLIPLLDILQSVPVLGYLSFTVTFFLMLFPHRVLGAELASIFAIFTSQAWNMAFSFFQALRTVPRDLDEASRGFRFSAWQRFWRLEFPFAVPGLVWNMMMSMSGGWFFRRCVRGDHRRRSADRASGHRLLCRAGNPAAKSRRGRLGHPGDDRRDPRLRPVDVPAAGRVGRRFPRRADRRADDAALLVPPLASAFPRHARGGAPGGIRHAPVVPGRLFNLVPAGGLTIVPSRTGRMAGRRLVPVVGVATAWIVSESSCVTSRPAAGWADVGLACGLARSPCCAWRP